MMSFRIVFIVLTLHRMSFTFEQNSLLVINTDTNTKTTISSISQDQGINEDLYNGEFLPVNQTFGNMKEQNRISSVNTEISEKYHEELIETEQDKEEGAGLEPPDDRDLEQEELGLASAGSGDLPRPIRISVTKSGGSKRSTSGIGPINAKGVPDMQRSKKSLNLQQNITKLVEPKTFASSTKVQHGLRQKDAPPQIVKGSKQSYRYIPKNKALVKDQDKEKKEKPNRIPKGQGPKSADQYLAEILGYRPKVKGRKSKKTKKTNPQGKMFETLESKQSGNAALVQLQDKQHELGKMKSIQGQPSNNVVLLNNPAGLQWILDSGYGLGGIHAVNPAVSRVINTGVNGAVNSIIGVKPAVNPLLENAVNSPVSQTVSSGVDLGLNLGLVPVVRSGQGYVTVGTSPILSNQVEYPRRVPVAVRIPYVDKNGCSKPGDILCNRDDDFDTNCSYLFCVLANENKNLWMRASLRVVAESCPMNRGIATGFCNRNERLLRVIGFIKDDHKGQEHHYYHQKKYTLAKDPCIVYRESCTGFL